MNKNKKWYSLFLMAIILLSTIIQPIQALAAVETNEIEEVEASALNINKDEVTQIETPVEDEVPQEEPESISNTETIDSILQENNSTSETASETTAESTVESTTESTEANTENLKKAQIQVERAPINIRDLLKSDEQFITGVDIAVQDVNKTVNYETEAVSPNAVISLKYLFAVPQRLIDEKIIKADDFFEMNLPSQLKFTNVSGPLKHPATGEVFGTYAISNGKIRVTFNQKVEELNDITGEFSYRETLNQTIDAGENIIKIPVGDDEETIHITVKPSGGDSISKKGIKGADNKSINWEVSINTNLSTLKNATVTDPMPDGTTLDNVKIYTQTVDIKGNPNVLGEQLVEGTDYTKNGDVITFIGSYAQTNKSFKLIYETTVDESRIPEAGGDVDYNNTATLTNEGQSIPASSKVTFSYGKLIDKSNAVRDTTKPGYVYNWTVKYNYGYKKLPENSSITDSLAGSNLEYIQDSVVVKTEAGATLVKDKDYQITFKDSQMMILFPNGINTAVKVDYQTKVPFVVDGKTENINLKNNVETNTGFKAGGSGTIARDGVVKVAVVNYKDRTIEWKITVNKYQYEMFNWSLKDTMSDSLTFDENNFTITSGKEKLVKGTDYQFVSSSKKDFHVEFIGDLATKGTNKSYIITYTTTFDRYQEKFKNTATTTWKDSTNKDYTQGAEKEVIVKPEYVTDATKGGSYNGQTKKITWTTVVNYNQDELKNAVITDPIIGDQDYVEGSAKLYEVTLQENGGYDRGIEVKGLTSINKKEVSAKLPDGNKVYMLVFETSLEGKVIQKAAYENKATYQNGDKKREVDAKVSVNNGGTLATKTGYQDTSNANYARWEVMINPTQSTLNDVKVIDKPSTNQVLDEDSIIIYGTDVDTNGNSRKNTQKKLEKGKDYLAEIVTDNITGQQVLTVSFTKQIDRAYVLEYRSLINSAKISDTLSNTVSMTASNEKVTKWETSSESKVNVSGGSANGSKASVRIVKLDQNTKERTPLSGATFELWSINTNGSKGTLIRSGETDKNGEIKFGNLRANFDYLLFETKAPKGFTVSDDLQKGQKVKFKADTNNTSLFEELAITNDMPRISFQKVDSKTNIGLAGAVFTVKNAEGSYYNGVNAKYEAQWVTDKKAISADVKTQLTSGKDGLVEVAGLEVGKYSIEELIAPEGYDRLSSLINFEVINDAGVIRLKDAIQPIKNSAYETTSLPVQKNWSDENNQDGVRPDKVTVTLLANGVKTEQTLTLTKDADWKNSFTGLRKFDADMKLITYSVEESEVAEYKLTKNELDDTGSIQLTNTHTPEQTVINVSKVWSDADNQDGVRPNEVVIKLLADNKETNQTLTLNEENSWKGSFTKLAAYQNGQKIKYTVSEVSVTGYKATITGDSEKGFVVTNTHDVALTSVKGTKTWQDADDQDGKRPESITVNLLADGEVVTHIDVNEKSNWTFEFKELPKYKAGIEIKYSIQELQVADYSATINNFDILNEYTPKQTAINVVKSWDDGNDQDGIRPSDITVELLADGKETGKTVKLTAENNWQADFTDLDVYKNKKEINYTIQEAEVTGYKTTISGNSKTGFVVTNTHELEETSVSVSKIWDDADNQDGLRPESIKVQLFADGEVTGEPVILSEATNWQQTWKNLAVNKAGKAITYTVKEISDIKGYEAKVVEKTTGNFTITNSHTPTTININGKKVWEDGANQDGIRPKNITINLLADGEKVAETTVKGSMTDSEWSYEFNEQPEFKDGKKIVYSVSEEKVEQYDVHIENYTITNSYKPKVTKMAVTKEWSDANNQDGKRVKEIVVELYANGKATGKTLTLSNAKKWAASFDNLALKAAGETIAYSIKELTNVNGYVAKVSSTDRKAETDELDVTVTNSYTPETIAIKGEKIWEDNNNQDGKRPESIQVNLMANGKKVSDFEASEATNWTYEFKDLPKFENGIEIKYNVQELAVADYSAEITDFKITNTHTPEKKAINVIKQWNDAANQDGIRPETITIKLLANGKATEKVLVLDAKDNWQGDFTDLDVYQNGKVIDYTIEEVSVDGYESMITGDSQTGFVVTNTHEVALTEVKGAKTWEDADNQDGKRPENIVVNLLADGELVASQIVTETTDWSYEFTDLPKFKVGQEIVYSISEDEVADYEANIDGFDITNKHTPETTVVEVSKVWKDADNQDGLRTKEVEIHLLANDKETGKTLVLNESNNWKDSFKDLAVYENGQKIKYTVSESEIAEYETKVTGDSETGFVVTNTHKVALTEVKVSKVWEDANDKDGIRPDSITIKLFANGQETDKVLVLTAKNNWQGSFKDLAVNKNGQKIEYNIQEVAVTGYTGVITGTSESGFIVTNAHTSTKVNIPSKPTTPTNRQNKLPQAGEVQSILAISLGLMMTAVMSAMYIQRRKEN